jgi:PTH1 family peptidyl-tRNA hydrolase
VSVSLVVGLGNIGQKYAETRHNLGFKVLNIISEQWKVRPRPGPGDFYILDKKVTDRTVRLIWPTTYMNNSGRAVFQAVELYDVPMDEILVVYDDYNLPLGNLRFRPSGSDGGHNGMASIIFHLATENVARLRLGIGPVPDGVDPVDFVLGRFDSGEVEKAEKMLEKSAQAVLYSLNNRLEEAMTIYNINPAPDDI